MTSRMSSVRNTIPLQKAVKYFKITTSRFYLWSQQVKTKCLETITDVCPRTYPGQLSKSEIKTMSDLLQKPEYKGWPIFAIAFEAIKRGILFIHPGSWYKYGPILGINLKLPDSRRKKRAIGIRASKVLGIIHADTTIFRPLNHTKVYIYLIVDNFSRRILAWLASLECKADLCIENLKSVFFQHILPRRESGSFPCQLMTDGGPENMTIHEFTSDPEVELEWLIAQKDTIFSNSIIEAVNKTLKYRHLFQEDIPDFNATVKHLERAIPVYNIRLECAL